MKFLLFLILLSIVSCAPRSMTTEEELAAIARVRPHYSIYKLTDAGSVSGSTYMIYREKDFGSTPTEAELVYVRMKKTIYPVDVEKKKFIAKRTSYSDKFMCDPGEYRENYDKFRCIDGKYKND